MGWNSNDIKISEDQLQRNCFTWFWTQHPHLSKRIYAVPNGGLRNKMVAMNLKRQGQLAGVWDIHVCIPSGQYAGAYIELKVGKNKLTDKQVEFQKANEADYYFAVCYTIEQFMETIGNYLTNHQNKIK